MPITIKLQDIDEAIENLHYKSETTLKARLLRAMRQYYSDDASSESLSAIDTEELVKTIWETGDDRELIKAKRKNFSSVKSSVNSDLKKLYADGKNPQGIIISPLNTFSISDEAKDKALSGIIDAFKEKGIDTASKITDILSALGDVLASAASNAAAIDAKDEIERLKHIMSGISDKLGLSLQDIIKRAESLGDGQLAGGGATEMDLPGHIRDGISALDKGVHGLAEEAAEALKSQVRPGMTASLRQALADIVEVLKDTITDTPGKAKAIMAAVEKILDETIDGAGLSGDQSGQLKQIIHEISEGAGEVGGQLLSTVTSILGDGRLSVGDKINRIMAAVNEMVGEALNNSGTGLEGEEIARIKGMVANVADHLGALVQENLTEVEAAGDQGPEGIPESVRSALADIVEVLKDTGTDISGKAKAIMAAVEKILDETIDGARDDLSGDEAGQLKNIIHEISQGAGEAVDKAVTPSPSQLAGGQLITDVSAILSGEGTGFGDKISQIMAAVNDMIGEALANSGLSGEEVAKIRDMMGNIAGNIEAFAQEALAEEDIVEEIIEDEADETVQVIDESPGDSTEGVEESTEDASADTLESALPVEEGTEVLDAVADLTEEVVDELTGENIEPAKEEAPPSGEDEIVEIIEEVVPEASQTALTEEAQAVAEEAAGEIAEIREDIAEAEGEAGALAPSGADEKVEEAPAGSDVVEEILDAGADVVVDETVEFADEMGSEVAATSETDTRRLAEAAEVEVMEEALAGAVEADESMLGGVEEVSEQSGLADMQAASDAITEVIEEITDQGIVEEILEDEGAFASGTGVTPSDKPIDDELREKTDLLVRLAEAAGVLEKLGPDLSGSIYTEEELRGKAKFLSEEFDRYLSIRDKFFNAHILIKGGDYLVGGAHLAKSELEEQIVTLPDLYVGKFPVTNALFEIFIEQTGYVTTAERFGYGLVYYPRMQRSRDPITGTERFTLHSQAYSKRVIGACWHKPSGPDSTLHLKRTHPVVQVSFEDARAYAAWTGKRLPTEIEWEAAARTSQGLLFPWGNVWQDDACNTEKSLYGDTTPVDQYVKFANSAEVADTLGNVLEWTMDVVGDKETSDTCIVKGASWVSHSEISLTDRHYIEKNLSSNILGFRCIAI